VVTNHTYKMKKNLYLLILLLFSSEIFAQYPTLLKDINTVGGISPAGYITYNNIGYFIHDDDVHGSELWRTDGTAAGTYMVKDVCPGYIGGVDVYSAGIVIFNSLLYFTAYTPTNGHELWKSDGTEAGTVLIKDIAPNYGVSGSPERLTNCGNFLIFSADDGTNGREIWKSDGTTAGTAMVSNLSPGAASSAFEEIASGFVLFSFVTNIYFTVKTSGTTFYKIYSMNYSAFGGGLSTPTLVSNTNYANSLCWFNQSLFFKVDDITTPKYEFKKYDGTTVTTIKTLGTPVASYNNCVVFNSKMYFVATDNLKGYELWQSDGTAAGTIVLKDINPGVNASTPNSFFVGSSNLYFTAIDGTNGYEPWKTDGTVAGTTLIADINSGINGSFPLFIANDNNVVYFHTSINEIDLTLNKYDATTNVYTQIMAFIPPTDNLYSGGTVFNHTLISSGYDAVNGKEVWKSDGTAAGTTLIKNISQGNSSPLGYMSVGASTFFTAKDNEVGIFQPFVSNGTTGGTVKLADISVDLSGSSFKPDFTASNGYVFFGANNKTNNDGIELWRTNGTPEGTLMVKNINPTPGSIFTSNSSTPRHFCNAIGTLFFSADDGSNGVELWKSDGTTVGTVLVKDIYTGINGMFPASSSPDNLIYYNTFLYFTAIDINGISLWRSDGTAAGTILIKTLNAYSSSSVYLNDFIIFKNKLFFVLDNGMNGAELWSSDGTAAGTNLFKDIRVGITGSTPKYLTANATTLYFSAETDTEGRELWKSDGTAAGTVIVNDLNISIFGPISSNPQNLTFVGNQLFFSCITSNPSLFSSFDYGRELWRTDGTVANTLMVKDINPADGGSGISDTYTEKFAAIGPYIYFPANNNFYGVELWKSDGYAAGTSLVNDLFEGTVPGTNANDGLYPYSRIHANPTSGQVFFNGTNGQNGRELWSFKFCPFTLNINTTVQTQNQKQQAGSVLTSSSNIANTNYIHYDLTVQYQAGNAIDLQPGFFVKAGNIPISVPNPKTFFRADIGGCN
jgi:trimeric autotransporter adhesin